MLRPAKKPAILVLENGSTYEGWAFGHETDSLGEVCFNTSMSGYQEILTDPSYYGQLITLTYPMIGNYGIDWSVNESAGMHAMGLIVKEYVDTPSNFTSTATLDEFLRKYQKPGIEGIDTRQLVLELREQGAMRGGIFMADAYKADMLEKVKAHPPMEGSDFASIVSTNEKYDFGDSAGKKYRVAVMDFGVKTNILRMLNASGFAVTVFPAKTPAEEIINAKFDAYFLSNGPGDPEPLKYAVETVSKLRAAGLPMFGICLGHQLIGLADGRSSYKLKFGHRGGNQPVKDLNTGKVEITSQNHGFAIQDREGASARLSHIALNDRTVEGFRDPEHHLMCVQYHPEAAPGPHDSAYLFAEFFNMVDTYHARRSA